MVTSSGKSVTFPSAKSRRDTQIFNPLPSPPKLSDDQEAQQSQESPPLSFSEPTLRFPRPQGNQSLAHWISSSNPDIMRLTSAPVEDTGLSDSTYELIAGTDTESQDGNFTDNISESVGSLEFHRPDDVVSLAGTDHTCDTESVVDATEDRDAPQDMSSSQALDQEADDDGSDDDGNSSRASLEYADHFLQTPSILTPEASRHMAPPRSVLKDNCVYRWLSDRLGSNHGNFSLVLKSVVVAIPGLLVLSGAVFMLSSINPVAYQDSQPIIARIASTISQTTLIKPTTENQHTNTASLNSPTNGVALIPLPNSHEGIFPSRKPAVSFTPHGKNDVLIHVAPEIRDTWLAKDCLNVTVMRSSQELAFTQSSVDDGILVKFPRREAYGVVNLSVESTCRPRTTKVIKVHFGKGIIVDAFERTKSLAQDLSELVPVAAHEAERCFAGAKRVLGSASESFTHAWLAGTERAQDLMINARASDVASLTSSASQFWQQTVDSWRESLTTSNAYMVSTTALYSTQTKLKLGLLDAQVSARMWWLKVQRKDAEYQVYASKARAFLHEKQVAAENLVRDIRLGKPARKARA